MIIAMDADLSALERDASAFQSALSKTGSPEMTTDSTGALSAAFERDLTPRRAAAELGLAEADFQEILLHLPAAFADLRPLTDKSETEQTIRRDTFLDLARELRCYLDALVEPADPSDSFCPEPGDFNETAVSCLDGQGLVEAGPHQGACVSCPDGTTDVTWYIDADGDGYAELDSPDAIVSCAPVVDHMNHGSDCDDEDASRSPEAVERCDDVDNDCDGDIDEDDDGDGWAPCDGDCDESDGSAHPSGEEVCDGLDNDCDGAPDDGLLCPLPGDFYTPIYTRSPT